ncbi:unnamed protein product, partial [Sphagnum balticum]
TQNDQIHGGTHPKKKNQTNKALQLLLGFLNSACKEKVSQIAAVATSSSSSSS